MRINHGIVAGLIATLVLSGLILMKSYVGLLPGFDLIQMLSQAGDVHLGFPQTPVTGWFLHFVTGTILGGVGYALLVPVLPGRSYRAKGIVFSILVWLVMMFFVMPLLGADPFALNLGPGPAIVTLLFHIVFGAVLGAVYGWFQIERNDIVITSRI
jgi:hypothetical protein